MKLKRCSGVLLHPTSLPGPYGIGDLGHEAYRFVDFLHETGQHLWQVLPLNPVGYGNSPYQSPSSFAGSILLISPERLRDAGLITNEELDDRPAFPQDHADFDAVRAWKSELLLRAHQRFQNRNDPAQCEDFRRFCADNALWLEDYALFMAIKERNAYAAWNTWETGLALREAAALQRAGEALAHEIEIIKFGQYEFSRQWMDLHQYCNARGILILGDIPIYVAHDSADVWANRELFQLDDAGHPTVIAGVPPDYFCETGQLWGNPIYRWDDMAQSGYAWWVERVRANLQHFDVIRLDHFRGFEAYWSVASTEDTAMHGQWIRGPEDDIFNTFKQVFGEDLPLIAEDLGVITPGVVALRERAGLRGMAVLEFGLGRNPETSSCPPHKYTRDLVAYTGTHDNETICGWAEDMKREDPERWEYVRNYLVADSQPFNWACIRLLMASVADVVITPLQDILGLGNEARMNRPGAVGDNWQWRFSHNALGEGVRQRLRDLTYLYERRVS